MLFGPARFLAPRLFALGVASAVLALPGSARAADEEPAVVLTIQTLDAFENADSFTSALKRALEEAPGWTVPKTDKDYALQVLTISLDCADPPDAACEQKIGDEIHVDHFLWGRMHKEGSDVTGDLHLWTRDKGSTTATFRYSANVKDAADDTLLAEARKHVAELVGPPPGGTLKILAGAITGPVFVDGKEAGKMIGGRVTLQVTPGPHKISIPAEGYNTMEAQVDLQPMESKELTLTPSVPSKGPDVQKILGFATMGLGVVAGGVAIGATVKTKLINDELGDKEQLLKDITPNTSTGGEVDLCAPGDGDDPYPNFTGPDAQKQYYNGLCDTGRTMQTLQLVMWPLAGALVGTGIVVVATSDWSSSSGPEAASVRIDPSFGPQGADLKMTVRF
jgi:hypothetical protein